MKESSLRLGLIAGLIAAGMHADPRSLNRGAKVAKNYAIELELDHDARARAAQQREAALAVAEAKRELKRRKRAAQAEVAG